MQATLNSDPVLVLSLHLPMSGAWSADVQVASEAEYAVGDVVTLTLPGLALQSRVMRAALFAERLRLRLTGGALDWGAPIEVKHYRRTTPDQILADVGVVLTAPTNRTLDFWTRSPGTVGRTVAAMAEYLGTNWRVEASGLVRMAAEAPAAVEVDHVEISRDAARGLVEVAPETAAIVPGVLVGADLVGDVVYEISDVARCRYYTDQRATIRGSLERLIRWVMRDVLYHSLYTAQVVRQAADGTLDLLPDDTRLRSQGLQGVPIRHGLPGVTVEVPSGERVLLGFDGGDPARPYAALWHEGQVSKVRIGGSEAVALASLVESQLSALKDAISDAVPTPNDGGAALKTQILASLATWPESTASEVLESR